MTDTGTTPFRFVKASINPILRKNTALGILGTLPGGAFYIGYHRFAIPNGDGTQREVCIDRLELNADGTIVPVVPR